MPEFLIFESTDDFFDDFLGFRFVDASASFVSAVDVTVGDGFLFCHRGWEGKETIAVETVVAESNQGLMTASVVPIKSFSWEGKRYRIVK